MIRKWDKLMHLVQQKYETNQRGIRTQGLENNGKCKPINYKG